MNAPRWQPVNRNAAFEAGFGKYVERLVRRSFANVRVRMEGAPFPQRGYIAVANHSSWWDGFAALLLHRTLVPHRPFAVMMDDEQLRRFPFFRMAGAFSVDRSSVRAARPAILHAADLAARGCGVWIFPQGALLPAASSLIFTSGFAHAAQRAKVPIIPVGMRYVFGSRQRPEMLLAVGESLAGPSRDTPAAAQELVGELLAQLDADVRSGMPEEEYTLLVRGSRGIDDRVAGAIRLLRRAR